MLCEKHFQPDDYVCGTKNLANLYDPKTNKDLTPTKKYLKPDAVPSIFDFPAHLKKEKTPRKPPARRLILDSPQSACPQKKPYNEKQTDITDQHNYYQQPAKEIAKLKQKLKLKNKKIKALQSKNIRKEKTIKGLVTKLERMKHLTHEQSEALRNNFGEMTREIFKNEAKNSSKTEGRRYTEQIKQFAVSLHFYSPKAYKFVRKAFHLPSPSTIRSWATSVECEPGFLKQVINHLQNNLPEDNKDCVLLVDEMSIKSDVLWDAKTKTFVGNVNYGNIVAEDGDTAAENALVVMAVGLKQPWSYPIAYFLVNGLTARTQSQIIKESINLITDAGLEVHAVIFDGCSKNLATARALGCKVENFDGSFQHPSRPGRTLYVILDVCHMLKLARNALGDKGPFCINGKQSIFWDFIVELYNMQKDDVLHLANKLKSKHIHWHNVKMKVAVAAQTLSNSVASGIRYLKLIGIPKFQNSDETAEFIEKINNMFDILNSKSKFGTHYKTPITLENIDDIEGYLNDVNSYLQKLEQMDGTKLVSGPRKTFVCGFALSSNSIIALARRLLERDFNKFNYLLTYRFSQDQIEMFFSKIRSRLGWNQNPTALQFKWAMRTLLQKNQITAPPTSNCQEIDDKTEFTPDKRILRLLDSSPVWCDDVLGYIGGYIVKQLIPSTKCVECVDAMVAEDQTTIPDHLSYTQVCPNTSNKLIALKSYHNGALTIPSPSVLKVVHATDKILRRKLHQWHLLNKKALQEIKQEVLKETKPSTFTALQQHSRDCHILDHYLRDDHTTLLIHGISSLYTKIFLYRFGKVYSEKVVRGEKPSKRQKLNKLILFGHD